MNCDRKLELKSGLAATAVSAIAVALLCSGSAFGAPLSSGKTQNYSRSAPNPRPSSTAEDADADVKAEPAAKSAPAKKDKKKKDEAAKPAEKKAEKKAEAKTEKKAEEKPAEKTEEVSSETLDIRGEKDSWLSLSGTAALVDGDKSAFRRRAQIPQDFSGGIEDFHTQGEVAKDTLLTLDGRSIFDNHDYLLNLKVTKPDFWYVDAGYREFRTWYDNTGGFFPKNGEWLDIYQDQEFAIDRGNIWFESGLTLPDVPEIVFRYERMTRQGEKDSTSWGDSTKTGRGGAVAFGSRGLVPSFWRMDEITDIFSLDAKHKLDDTNFGAGVRYELYTQDDRRYMWRRPFETGQSRIITQKEMLDTDLFSVHGWQETDLDEDSKFTTAYAYMTLDADLDGSSRIYGASLDSPYIPRYPHRQQRDEGFFAERGGGKIQQHVATLNYMTVPCEDSYFTAGLRIEDEKTEAGANYEETDIGAAPGRIPSVEHVNSLSKEESLNVSESMELRYVGVVDWLFYLRANWDETQGDFYGRQIDAEDGLNLIAWNQDIERFAQKYAMGANWYPTKEVSTSAQYFYRARSTTYAFPIDSTVNGPRVTDRYPDYLVVQDSYTHDLALRLTAHPCNWLTLVSRYDLQLTDFETKGGTLDTIVSARLRNHLISQSATWNATSRLYFQGNVSWNFNETNTPADERPGLAGAAPANEVMDSFSNYWYGSLIAGFALTQDVDLQGDFSFYNSYPYIDNSGQSMPYGTDTQEYTTGLGMIWRLCENVRWRVRYSFMKSQDYVSGGHNDFDAHLAYSAVDVAF